ncbi:hypothetical protein IEQ34_019430 [Dendrobium chrysotoxum]|uniref:C2 domain-containing protein n=1 Tax=Dendrobium chrysotoxum TaxID=161865 RepID=A0AAV7G6U8_DENCH|nr:hypothetical protein IEQ34_019430 [Dendrobium chrysotoxum]
MSGGVLEVLLVNAEGLKHARLPDDNGKARWNEKFSFKLSHLDLEKLTRIKLWIIRQDKFFEDYHIGEATIHLMDILKEGIRRGSIELKPAPYNVVLEDRTFKGEIKVGLRFISDVSSQYCSNQLYLL